MAASTSIRRTGCSVTSVARSGVAADLEQRIALAQGAVLGHVAAGLPHEPDGRGVDRLAPAGFEETAY